MPSASHYLCILKITIHQMHRYDTKNKRPIKHVSIHRIHRSPLNHNTKDIFSLRATTFIQIASHIIVHTKYMQFMIMMLPIKSNVTEPNLLLQHNRTPYAKKRTFIKGVMWLIYNLLCTNKHRN